MVVRLMTAADISSVAALEAACFSRPWSEEALFEELHNPTARFLVADDNGLVVGYMGMHALLDEGAITNVAVSPAHRRRGIARALLRHQAAWGGQNGLSRLMLEVRASNIAARALYEQEGFVFDGVRPRFYDRPVEDAALYSLYLKEGSTV